MLRSLLTYARHDDSVEKLVADSHESPQRAFVSASLRPYLLASLLDSDPERPALIVAGGDRAARGLAADLEGQPSPRPGGFYPGRGQRYEAPPAPPPPLGGRSIAPLAAAGALLPGAGHALRVPPRAAAASGRASDRRARLASGGEGGRARDLRRRARGEGPRSGSAAARLRDREGRPDRPRRDRGAA